MRLKDIPLPEMNAAQKAARDAAVAGPRGYMPEPMRAWIHAPELALRIQHLGAYAIYGTSLPPHLKEIAVLVTARHWTAQFEWFAHRRMALDAGVPPAVVDAIARGEPPQFDDPDAELVYTFARTIWGKLNVDEALYNRAIARLGDVAVVELVAVVGYYSLVSMTLNIFDIGVPPGETPELQPLPTSPHQERPL